MSFGPHNGFIYLSYGTVLVSLSALALSSWLKARRFYKHNDNTR